MKRMTTQWMAGALALTMGMLAGAASAEALVSTPANGSVVAFSTSHPDYPGTNAYDGNATPGATPGRWIPDRNLEMPAYVTWQFASAPHVITKYRIMGTHLNWTARSPMDFGLYGSNDGVNWAVVDERTGETSWVADEWREYVTASPGAFFYYKVSVSAFTGTDQYGAIREIELHGEVGSLTWATPSVSDVTATTAQASAVTDTALDAARLLWDTTDKGTADPDDWTGGNLSLGAQAADATASGQITGLAADTLYTFRFYGEHGVETEWSMPVTFATALTAAQTPEFTGAETTFQSVMLQWTDNANTETGYVLRRAISPSGPFDVIAELGPNTTSYLDAGLVGETTYHYQLAAVNSANDSSTAFESCVTQATTAARPLGKLMFSSPVAPSVTGEDIASFGSSTGTDKWWAEDSAAGRTIGQTFTTPSRPVLFNAFTFQVGSGTQPNKTYVLRLGTVSGTTFTAFHSETFTQDFITHQNDYWTYQVEAPVALDPDTLYGVDVGMTASTSGWETGIPYTHRTADVYPGGTRFRSGTLGVGNDTMVDVSGDRIFHVNLLLPPPSGTLIMIK